LDDFLEPLYQGVDEVTVPKTSVTEPLDAGWKESKFNVPSPRMLTSYRKGRQHVHVYEGEYRVHLDRYDPEKSPLLHLMGDAPLLLMVWETIGAFTVEASDTARGSPARWLANLRFKSVTRMALGAGLVLLGALLVLFPLMSAELLFTLVLPLVVIGIGLLMLVQGLRPRPDGTRAAKAIAIGAGVVAVGIALFFLWKLAALLILLILAMWFLSSAVLTFMHARSEGKASPRTPWPMLAIGLLSLALGIASLFFPKGVVELLLVMLGVVAVLMGALLILDGLGLKRISREMGRAEPMAQDGP
jgi:uncharacterized membrane protein HdeD (DUF308 family)